MSTLLWRRVHSERWGGKFGTSSCGSSASSPYPVIRKVRNGGGTFIIDYSSGGME